MEADLHNLVDEREGVFKVVVSLPEDAWHNFSSELLWAEALEDGTMRVLRACLEMRGYQQEQAPQRRERSVQAPNLLAF
ncbi:hypothetical protein [Ralstonia solanacearum]|uniref:hypothetical protein n=1 Tax=Ralstonia solanacearum TaxID=305 RepID=UPI001FFC6A03|nr:hypothetical protein [Ralstonia solanacearum]